MSRLIVLDAGPVGLLGKAPGRPDAARCRYWLDSPLRNRDAVAVPEIARYEVRRELFRLGSSGIASPGSTSSIPGCSACRSPVR